MILCKFVVIVVPCKWYTGMTAVQSVGRTESNQINIEHASTLIQVANGTGSGNAVFVGSGSGEGTGFLVGDST